MKNRILSFMRKRYGSDELNICLFALYLILWVLSLFWPGFLPLSLVCIAFALFRAFSSNISKRRSENAKILPYILFFKAVFKDKGKNRLFLCPKCKRTLRIPKGKGKVTLKCPCGESLMRKS